MQHTHIGWEKMLYTLTGQNATGCTHNEAIFWLQCQELMRSYDSSAGHTFVRAMVMKSLAPGASQMGKVGLRYMMFS